MIVIDSNVLVYLYLPTELTTRAEKLKVIVPECPGGHLLRRYRGKETSIGLKACDRESG